MNKLYLFVVIILTAACGITHKTAESPVKESDFKPTMFIEPVALTLTQLNQAEAEYKNEEYDISLTIDLEEGTYNGKSGCNNFFGSVKKVGEHVLKFDMAGVTEMMCVKEVMLWEARYLNALTENQFDVYESGDLIQLKDIENNVVLNFSKK